MPWETMSLTPRRLHAGLPAPGDGTERRPLLVAFEGAALGGPHGTLTAAADSAPSPAGAAPPRRPCNNGCATCVTGREGRDAVSASPQTPAGDDAGAVPWREDLDVVGKHVVVWGGEPTLDPAFLARLASLRAGAPASLRVVTNGRMLAYRKFAQSLSQALAQPLTEPLTEPPGRSDGAPERPTGGPRGPLLDVVVIKLFGPDAATHDAHTRVPGSFEQARRGAREAQRAGLAVRVTFPLSHRAHAGGRLADYRHGAAGEPAPRHDARTEALARALTGAPPVAFPEPQVWRHAGEFRLDLVTLTERGLQAPFFRDLYFPMAHVHLGAFCNLRCVYCNVRGGTDPRLNDDAYVEAMIDYAAREVLGSPAGGRRPTLDFIGGEPTAHPRLPKFVRRAREAGFPEVSVCTNGVLLGRKEGLLPALVEAGLTMVRYSLHHHEAQAANALAGRPGLGDSYPEVGKRLLGQRQVHVHLYRILVAQNLDSLPAYMRWLSRHNRTGAPVDLALGVPSMRGRVFDDRGLLPALDDVRRVVDRALDEAPGLGIDAFVHHAPACLASDPTRSSALHLTLSQRSLGSPATVRLEQEGDARFGRACQGCAARDLGCEGVAAGYWERDPEATEAWLRPIRSLP